MNLSQKTTHAIRISLWHIAVPYSYMAYAIQEVVFEKSAYLVQSSRMNLSQKLLTLLGFPFGTNIPSEGLLYGIGAVCVKIVVFEKSAYLVKKFKKCH